MTAELLDAIPLLEIHSVALLCEHDAERNERIIAMTTLRDNANMLLSASSNASILRSKISKSVLLALEIHTRYVYFTRKLVVA